MARGGNGTGTKPPSRFSPPTTSRRSMCSSRAKVPASPFPSRSPSLARKIICLRPKPCARPSPAIDTNLEILGYRGAELLDDLMDGKPAPRIPFASRPPASSAQSSDILTIPHRARGPQPALHLGTQPRTHLCQGSGQCRRHVAARSLHMAFLPNTSDGRTDRNFNAYGFHRAKQLLIGSGHKNRDGGENVRVIKARGSFCIALTACNGMSAKIFREKNSGSRTHLSTGPKK